MKQFSLILFIVLSIVTYGQSNLCNNCAFTIVEFDNNSGSCCEDCLRRYYVEQLQQNISHGSLSRYYEREAWSTFIPLPNILTSNFYVAKIENHLGFYLKKSELVKSTYCLINLECRDSTVIQPGSSIVLVVDDSSFFEAGKCYDLTLHPYFNRNQNFRLIDHEIRPIIGCSHTLFDLVYKEWLIVMLPMGCNYFFL